MIEGTPIVRLPGGAPAARDERLFAGLAVGSGCAHVSAVFVAAEGEGYGASVRVVSAETAETDRAVQQRYARLLGCTVERPGEAGLLAAELADVQAELLTRLESRHRLPADGLLAVGVTDPGLWHLGPGQTGYVALCNSAYLAEATGHNIVDAFPARDLASGGQGGPTAALPQWMLLRHPEKTRVLLDLGRTARITYLPAGGPVAHGRVVSFDAGPGTLLLDHLTTHLSGGNQTFDPGGRLAVQGRRIDKLIDHWLADPYFQKPPPRWHPLGVHPDAELDKTVRMAVEAGWNIRDLLCTATHLIAECAARAVRRLPRDPPITELVLFGGGTRNGMLLAEIGKRLDGISMARGDKDLDDHTLAATTAALLCLLFVDRVPANHPAVTGTRTCQVLGRLTPGSDAAWRGLLAEMAHKRPTDSLRAAI